MGGNTRLFVSFLSHCHDKCRAIHVWERFRWGGWEWMGDWIFLDDSWLVNSPDWCQKDEKWAFLMTCIGEYFLHLWANG